MEINIYKRLHNISTRALFIVSHMIHKLSNLWNRLFKNFNVFSCVEIVNLRLYGNNCTRLQY